LATQLAVIQLIAKENDATFFYTFQ